MRADYVNFSESPWHMVAWAYDLDAGYFRILRKQGSKEMFILVRASKWIPTKGKDNGRKSRKADGRLFLRSLPLGKENLIVDNLCKRGYKPERELII